MVEKAMPLWMRVIYDTPRAITIVLPRMIRDMKYRLRVRINRALKGYDECDWWEYYSNNSRRAVKLLTLLKEKGHGFVCMQPAEPDHDCWGGICQAKWIEALDDMISFHSMCAGDSRERWDLNKPGHEEDLARFERGRKAYMDNYEKLWD